MDCLNVKNVFNAIENVADWFTLGLNLNVSHSKLQEIERNYADIARQKQEMIAMWLNGNPEATWNVLIRALKNMGYEGQIPLSGD